MVLPLTHGSFICVPDHAVECAHVLNAAEAAYGIDPARAGLDAIPIPWRARFVSACCGAVVVGGFWRFGFDSGASWAVAFGASFVAAAVWIITLARG